MQKPSRLSLRRQIRHLKNAFFQFGELPFKDLLPTDLINRISSSGDPREDVFSPLVTLKAFLFQVLSATGSCKEAVAHILAERLFSGLEANSMSTGPYCKARHRLLLPQLKEAVMTTGEKLHRHVPRAWTWKGFHVVLADGATMLMPDTDENQQAYPQQSAQKPGLGFPIARLVGLLSLSTGACLNYAVGAYQGKGSGESSLLSKLLGTLGVKDLLIADRYYCTYAIIALMLEKHVPVMFRLHANKTADFRRGRRLGAKDHLVTYQKPKRKPVWMSKQAYADLPDTLTVRECAVEGIVYVTTLLEAKTHPKKELAALYHQRWKIELDFRTIKTHMGMEMLRCKTPEMVGKEIAVNLLAYNLIRANLARAAIVCDKQPRHLSFIAAVQLMRNTAGLCMQKTSKALEELLVPLLKAIAYTIVGKYKRKNQPRVVKRRPKPFPLMNKPRDQYTTG